MTILSRTAIVEICQDLEFYGFDSIAQEIKEHDATQREAIAKAEQKEFQLSTAEEAIDRLTYPLCIISLKGNWAQKALANHIAKSINQYNNVNEEAQGAQAGDDYVPEELIKPGVLAREVDRAALATQPAASEPVGLNCQVNIPKRKCSKNLPYRGFLIVEGWNSCIDEFLAINPHLNLDPPAAAHGDEAVVTVELLQRWKDRFAQAQDFSFSTEIGRAIAAMRAQGGEGGEIN